MLDDVRVGSLLCRAMDDIWRTALALQMRGARRVARIKLDIVAQAASQPGLSRLSRMKMMEATEGFIWPGCCEGSALKICEVAWCRPAGWLSARDAELGLLFYRELGRSNALNGKDSRNGVYRRARGAYEGFWHGEGLSLGLYQMDCSGRIPER